MSRDSKLTLYTLSLTQNPRTNQNHIDEPKSFKYSTQTTPDNKYRRKHEESTTFIHGSRWSDVIKFVIFSDLNKIQEMQYSEMKVIFYQAFP